MQIICSACGTLNTAVPALGQTKCGKCGVDLLNPQSSPAPSRPVTRGQVIRARAILTLIGLFVLAFSAWAIYNFVPGIKPIPAGYYTSAQLEQVQRGMTYLDVVTIFYGRKPQKPLQQKTDDYGPYLWAAWENPDGTEGVVYFNLDGIVTNTLDLNLP